MRGHIFSWFQRWAGYVDPRWKRGEELLINALQRKERDNQNEGEKDQVKGAGIQRGSLAVGKHQGEQSTTLCRSNGEEGSSRADRLGKNSSRWLCSGQCNALLLPCQTVFRENCIPHSSIYLFIFNWGIIALQYCMGFYQTPTWPHSSFDAGRFFLGNGKRFCVLYQH